VHASSAPRWRLPVRLVNAAPALIFAVALAVAPWAMTGKPPPPVSAEELPPSLQDEHFTNFTDTDYEARGVIDCNPDGTSTVTFTAWGTAVGPYEGTYAEEGSFTFGPVPQSESINFPIEGAEATGFESSFRLESGDNLITGRRWLDPTNTYDTWSHGYCAVEGNWSIGKIWTAKLDYEARIETPTGAFRDTGETFLEIQLIPSNFGDPTFDKSTNWFRAVNIASNGVERIGPSEPPAGLVVREGGALLADGEPYSFIGMNVYNANTRVHSCWYPFDQASLEASFTEMGPDVEVIRAWFFQDFATVDGARSWEAFDATLAAAEATGKRLIVTLGNQWADCDREGLKTAEWYEEGYTRAHSDNPASYRDFVAEVVERYADRSSVLMWQLLNEAEVPLFTTEGLCDEGIAHPLLKAWAADVSGLVKLIDPYHLVSIGTIGSGQCGAQHTDYHELHAIPTVDLCEFHDYGPDVMPGDQWNGLAFRLEQCAELDKPLFVGETGIDPRWLDGTLEARAELFRDKFQTQFDAGVVGEVIWAWNAFESRTDTFDIGPGDPVFEVLGSPDGPSDTTPPAIQFTTPADGAVYTVGDEVIVEFSCTDEDGGSGLVDCIGDVDDGEPLFLVPGTYGFEVTAEDDAGNLSSVTHIYEVVALADADGDGLSDAWETGGIDADGDGTVDLALHQPPFNANPNRKDIFVEIDHMTCAAGGCAPGDSHSHEPEFAGLDDVRIAFADAPVDNPDGSTGITLHLMPSDAMPHSEEVAFITQGPGATDDYDDYKLGAPSDPCDGYFGTAADRSSPNCAATLQARRLAFHYAIFGHSYSEGPLSSGFAEILGNDLMVTLGDPAAWIDASGSLREAEAGTLMHELGHNLGLHHGGADSVNCKPNYLSVMNYTLQVPYMDPTRPLDYSRFETLTLEEDSLTETNGIGQFDDLEGRYVIHGVDGFDTYSLIGGTGDIDWNGNGDLEGFVTAADVNWLDVIGSCGESPGDELTGHDDWSNLVYNFRAYPDFAHGSRQSSVDLIAEELPSDVALEVAETVDFDGDGTANADDSCPAASDPAKGDMDGDGVNDACDTENLAKIDILPGVKANTIPKGLKLIPVAILSTATFDATKAVDRTSLTFGKTGSERSRLLCLPAVDVNKDRKRDLVCVFGRGGLVPGDTVGVLRGNTTAGAPFIGRDSVVIKR
jgi:mannan endo-1,4-beta-mannosidase